MSQEPLKDITRKVSAVEREGSNDSLPANNKNMLTHMQYLISEPLIQDQN